MRPLHSIGILTALAACFMAGCAHYKAVGNAEATRVALAPIINEAEVPQIIAPLARNLRERLNHSPNWRLVDEADAEVILRVTLTSRERDAVARDPVDTGRPLSHYDTLFLNLEWESDLPAPWGPRPVTRIEADTLLYAQPSLVTGETAAAAELADELARKIVARMGWPR